MDVSARTYDEIRAKMLEAGYDHAFAVDDDGKQTMDMNGLALQPLPPPPAQGTLQVGLSADETEVIINHPDLQADAQGNGHITFSAQQARDLAALLVRKAMDIEGRTPIRIAWIPDIEEFRDVHTCAHGLCYCLDPGDGLTTHIVEGDGITVIETTVAAAEQAERDFLAKASNTKV